MPEISDDETVAGALSRVEKIKEDERVRDEKYRKSSKVYQAFQLEASYALLSKEEFVAGPWDLKEYGILTFKKTGGSISANYVGEKDSSKIDVTINAKLTGLLAQGDFLYKRSGTLLSWDDKNVEKRVKIRFGTEEMKILF